jgi:hypothetical protein
MPVRVCVPDQGSTLTRATVPISTNARQIPEENFRDICTSVLLDMHSGKFHDGVRKSSSCRHVPAGCSDGPQDRSQQKEEILVPGN